MKTFGSKATRPRSAITATSRSPLTSAPPGAEVAETHISTVLFLGDRAYKLKKPIRTGFIDLSTPERRRIACEREVALNRRLSPDVYLGVATVSGLDGNDCDYLTVMRRLPADRRLSHLIRAGYDVREPLAEIARMMAAFHASATRSQPIDFEGGPERLLERWRANLAETEAADGLIPDARRSLIGEMATGYIEGRTALFEQRVGTGHIVDGHGDLLADDIFCLPDGPRLLDCLEFDDRLRFVDVIDDISFLAMDLEREGRADLGELFVDLYKGFSNDGAPQSLVHHYIAYRAFVRAKVAALRVMQGDATKVDEVKRLLHISEAHLLAGRPTLALIGGAPGSGKSTIARALSGRFGWSLLHSDVVRKELTKGRIERAAGAFNQGAYDPDVTRRVYAELVRRAERLLGLGRSVVLDASWTVRDQRAIAEAMAASTKSRVVQLRCSAPQDIRGERIAARTDPVGSDATPEIGRLLYEAADPWANSITIDTSGSVRSATDAAEVAVS